MWRQKITIKITINATKHTNKRQRRSIFLCHPHNKSYENPQKACVGAFYIRVRLTLALLHLQTNSVYIWN